MKIFSNTDPRALRVGIIALLMSLLVVDSVAQDNNQRRRRRRANTGPPTLGLDSGTIDLSTPQFNLRLVRDSQTIAALEPKGAGGFDFTPADRLGARASNGSYHLGDLTLRVRMVGTDKWQEISTAADRKPVGPLEATGSALAVSDLAPTLPEDCPLQITRSWAVHDDALALRFDLTNRSGQAVEIGALGIPMVFNNIITRRSLEEAHEKCSFVDPYIGQDAGYLQVTRLNGQGPALVVVPVGKAPLEGYQLLREPMRPIQTFEGNFEWLVHTKAYAENEWSEAEPWNAPTSVALAPNETRTYQVAFLVSDTIRGIEDTLAAHGRPVAVGIPGYILPMDIDGRLFLDYPQGVASLTVTPENAITIRQLPATANGWKAYALEGNRWGRARLTVTYDDGLEQSINYNVIKPAQHAVADLGNFLFTKQWFDDPDDPFGRSPSVMSYDRGKHRIVTQDSRVWIAGLGDEGGSGSWLAAAMKQLGQPNKQELEKYQRFIDNVLWGGIQYADGERKYGVRKSMFYYEPEQMPEGYYDSELNWGTWTSWNLEGATAVNRSYNYPHVAAAYWVMYRLARNYDGLVTNHDWQWFLERAYETSQAMVRHARGYTRHGQMEGDIFVDTLLDLQQEGWTEQASALEATMRARVDRWENEAYPFGSEMAWDSTGQEEVYAWCKYFGLDDKAQVSLNSILGYMPTVPHWGYNGNARRYWDFLYGGKLSRIERQIHHYGSGINAIPVLAEYRENPDDFYLLRVGYGGMLGALTNIDQEGFASAAFHSFPSTLAWDDYSGDYGPNFLGHALNTATYVIDHTEFGWQAFGGNVSSGASKVSITPLDSFRMRVYIAPLGLWLTLDAGKFEQVEIDTQTDVVRVALAPSTEFLSAALLRIEKPADAGDTHEFVADGEFTGERGALRVPLESEARWITLQRLAD